MTVDHHAKILCLAFFSMPLMYGGASHASVPQEITETPLIEILSEPEGGLVHELLLGLDENGDIAQMTRRSTENEDVFDVQELLEGEIVLATASGYDAVLLSGTSGNPHDGGELRMRYLKNGIFQKYEALDMYLIRGEDEWELYTLANERIYNLTLKSNMFWGQLIGIESVVVNGY